MDAREFVDQLNANAPDAVRKLGGRVHAYDDNAQTLEMRYRIDASFCHSGNIVQGGFVAGMLDAAMAHAVFAVLGEIVIVASLEIKVSYFAVTKPGELRATGRIVKLGNSIGFLEAELRDESGDLLAAATSTAKIIRQRPLR